MKKKILYFAIALIVMIVGINNAAAYEPCPGYMVNFGGGYTCVDASSSSAWGRFLHDGDACRYGRYNPNTINAVRLTVVDANGQRVSNSVDFYSGSLPGFGNYRISTEKKTRNEIISGGTGYTISGTRPHLEPLYSLPSFSNANDAAAGIMKSYFLNSFASINSVDIINAFQLMGYEGYKNALLYENHYLLIEPIFQFFTDYPRDGDDKCTKGDGLDPQLTSYVSGFIETQGRNGITVSWDEAVALLKNPTSPPRPSGWKQIFPAIIYDCQCQFTHNYYYGTATEIFYIMKQMNEPMLNYKTYQGGSIATIIHNLGGLIHDDQNRGGLLDATSLLTPSNRMGAYEHMLDNYGLGTMHVWMKDIIDGCPNGLCPTTCPDGTILAEGEDPAIACPPTYCPDGVTPIPYGQTAAEVCPGYTPTCNYDLKTKITNDCTDGQEGWIRDIGEDENGSTNLDEWKCIFDTANAPRNTYEGEFYHPNGSTFFDNNPYCRVACRETVKYKLPSTFEEVAGRRFTIGISNDFTTGLTPNVIEGTTTCSTAYAPGTEVPAINYELFKQHYAAANIAVEAAWDAYQIELAKEKSANDIIQEYQSGSGEHNCREDVMCPGGQDENTAWHQCQYEKLIGRRNAYDDCGDRYIQKPDRHCERSAGECPNGPFEHDGQSGWTQTTHVGRVYSYKGQNYQITYVTSSDGHHGDNKPSFNTATLKTAYEAAVEQRRILLKVLNMCNNFQRTYSEFEPTLSFAYSETKYKGSYKLAATSQTAAITNYLVNNQTVGIHEWSTAGYEGSSDVFKADLLNSYGSIDYVDRMDCDNELQPCVMHYGAQAYPNNISVIQITRKTYNFEIPSDANRYVAKNGKSYNTAYDAELSDYPYIDTGRSNMPVNYSTQGGWYHYYYDYYYANGTANLFGTNQKFLKYNKVEPGGTSSYNGLTLADNLLYHCIYKVDCGLVDCVDTGNTCPDGSEMPPNGKCPDYTIEHKICPSGIPMPISGKCPDGKGISIIYRTISLDDPFPGESGNGRSAGANWNGEATVLGTRMNFIDAYITNNRGVTTEDVYQETPMYQFTLTPANIRNIRKYNRSTGNDYNDFELECSNGKYCKSEFLEEGISNGYFGFSSKNPTGGSCFNAYSTNWESCRYSSIGG